MARIGEHDERWIVDDRTDGKNVNNWHWAERSLVGYAKEVFNNDIIGMEIPNDQGFDIVFTELEKLDGFINICNRKGKTMYYYDFSLKLKWKGEFDLEDGEKIKADGSYEIKDIDNDNDYRFTMSMKTKENANTKRIKEVVRSSDTKKLFKDLLFKLLVQIGEEKLGSPQEEVPEDVDVSLKENISVVTTEAPKAGKKSTTTIRQTIVFNDVNPERLHDILTDQNALSALTQSPCQFKKEAGSEFKLMGGTIEGKTESLDNVKIKQTWRFSQWEDGHSSKLEMSFSAHQSGGTEVKLVQRRVPSDDEIRTRSGWENIFWRNIRNMFGWQYRIVN